jgi:sigma54-dependent transcription regulator
MKPRDAIVRGRQFEIDEKRRQLADMESMVQDFRRMAADLDQQIEAEHQRAGVRDPNHFAYPPFAKAARNRRDNLLASVDDLQAKLEAGRLELDRVEDELKRLATSSDRTEDRSRFVRRPRKRSTTGSAASL